MRNKKQNVKTEAAENKQAFDEEKIRHLVDNIMVKAKAMGASAAEVDASVGVGISVNVRNGEIDTVEYSNGKELGVTVYFGQRIGAAITSDFKPEAVQLMLEKACHIARYTSEDPYLGLADPKLMAYDYPDLDLDHPWNITVKEATDLAKKCEALGFAKDKRIVNGEGTSVNTSRTFNTYANSHGFVGYTAATRHSIGSSLIAEENGDKRHGSYYSLVRDHTDLESIETIANQASNRAIRRLKPRHLATCECPVIFVAEIAKTLLGNFIAAISGGSIYRKSSFLVDCIGKQVFAKHLHIDERPLIPKAIGSAAFDDEGVRTKQSDIVVDGILRRYILDSYSARKLNMQTTGNAGGIYNLFVNTSDLDFNGLLRSMNRGLVVIELMGEGVNLVTGHYSEGAVGLWIENGEIQYPVEEVTIAGNLKDMFLNLVAVGKDVDRRGSIITGSMLIEKMSVSGK